VDELSWFSQGDEMPNALRDDKRFTCGHLDGSVASGQLEPDGDRPGDHVQQLVTVGVDLASVGRVAGEHRCPDGEAIDALGRSAADLLDEPGSSIGAVEADDLARQVDPLAWFDLVGRAHVPSPVVVGARPLEVVRRWRLIGSRTWVDRTANISAMTVSDAAAIAASVTDPAAFAAIFDHHAASIHRFLARRVEPAEAESLLGEVFRVAFERRETFDLGRVAIGG